MNACTCETMSPRLETNTKNENGNNEKVLPISAWKPQDR